MPSRRIEEQRVDLPIGKSFHIMLKKNMVPFVVEENRDMNPCVKCGLANHRACFLVSCDRTDRADKKQVVFRKISDGKAIMERHDGRYFGAIKQEYYTKAIEIFATDVEAMEKAK